MKKTPMRRFITILVPCLTLTLNACAIAPDTVTRHEGGEVNISSQPAYGAEKYPSSNAKIELVKLGDRELIDMGYVKVGKIFAENTDDPTKIIEEARKLGGERIKYLYRDLDWGTISDETVSGCSSFDFGTSYGAFGKYDYMKCNKTYGTRTTINKRIVSELTVWRRDPAHVREYLQWQAAESAKIQGKLLHETVWRETKRRNDQKLSPYHPNRIEIHGPFTLGIVGIDYDSVDVYLIDNTGQATFINTAYHARNSAASSGEAIAVATYNEYQAYPYRKTIRELTDIAVINTRTKKVVTLPPYLAQADTRSSTLQFSDGLLPLRIKAGDKTYQTLTGFRPLQNVEECVYLDTNGEIALGQKAIGGKQQITTNILATAEQIECMPFSNGLAFISGPNQIQVINKTGNTVYAPQRLANTDRLHILDESGDVATTAHYYNDNYPDRPVRQGIGFPSGPDRHLLSGKARILLESCENKECLKGQHTWLDAQGQTLATRTWLYQCLQTDKNRNCEQWLYHWTDGTGRAAIDARQKESPETVMSLAKQGKFDLVRDSIEHSTLTVNSRATNREENLLMAAAEGGNLALVKWLVQNGADTHYTGANGNALLKACNPPDTARFDADRIAIIKYLTEQGVSARIQDNLGRMPLTMLVINEHEHLPELINLLLRNGADINAKNQWGRTALMTAVQVENITAVKALLRHKPDLAARDTDGYTALGLTGKYNSNREIVTMLTAAGAI